MGLRSSIATRMTNATTTTESKADALAIKPTVTLHTLLAKNGYSLLQALQELEREKGVRVRCYEDWIDKGKLGKYEAQDRMARLSAAMQFLDYLASTILSKYGEDRAKEVDAHMAVMVV